MAELKVKVPIEFSEKAQKDLYETCVAYKELAEMRDAENAKLRELVRGMRAAYIAIINKCEGLDESLTWEFSSSIESDIAKQRAGYEQDRHRFDVAMRELGIEASE